MDTTTPTEQPRSEVDQMLAMLRDQLGANVPRSVAQAALGLADKLRVAPELSDAPLSSVMAAIASTGLVIATPGGAQGSLSRIGDQAALAIVNKLQGAGIRLMQVP